MFHGVKGHEKSFSASCDPKKKRLGQSRLSDVLSRRMALGNRNLFSRRPKNDFVEVDEAIFQGVQGPCEHIFCILGIEKSDLDEVP
jgi:hypothetical protein